jgi:hypothetical protein
LISSASSKTAIALGYLVSRAGRARAVGITSRRNREFVRGLGCYDEVLTYEEVEDLDANQPVVFVDMAGSASLRRAVHEHFGRRLLHSCSIGATHWQEQKDEGGTLPGPTPEFFFAPGQVEKRSAEWGARELQRRLAAAWSDFREFSEGWLQVRRGHGKEALAHVYEETLAGRIEPHEGHVLSLWGSG